MLLSDCLLNQSNISINYRTEKQNTNKSKKRFIVVTEKHLKTEESVNT